MDVRQFAFLAGQPSAALKNREHFWGLPKRGLAFILANAMFWQPLLTQADGIVVNAPGTTLGQAGNGVPIVNIAAPNAQGLSHNQFSDYNVGANGVILNNATNRTQSTQLGGIILGDPNFIGAAANVILNEVNGGSPSQLRGYTEVAGQSAHVIVANPYGISCNGCGFINTPQVTLTTGKAVITNGQVTGYQVDQGSVSIDGAGLNASNIDQFEIITRAATINAQINANQLTVIAGRNDVDAHTLKATARADDGSTKPQVAIDSTALGGMYAGAIKLVGTEAGVGVKLAGNLAASGGDIQLDANGQLSMVQATASGAVNVKAASLDAQGPVYAGSSLSVQTTGDLNSQNNLAARDSVTLNSGGQLTNHGIIEAGVNADNTRNSTGDVSVTAQNVVNTGQSVIASRDLSVTATQTLGNQGGTLSGQRQTSVTASTLDNQNKGRVLSAGQLNLTVDTALNGLGGLINSSTALTAALGHLVNSNGQLSTDGTLNLTVDNLENGAGTISSQGDLSGTVQTLGNQAGVLVSQGNLSLSGDSLDNTHAGLIGGVKGTTLTVGQIDNRGGELSSTQAVTLVGQQLNNDDNGKVLADTDLHVNVAAVTNRNGGQLLGKAGTTTLNGSSLDNSGGTLSGKSALIMTLDGALTNLQGLIASDGSLSVNVGSLDNSSGNLSSGTALTVTSNGAVVNQGGTIATDATLGLTSASLDNSQSGVLTGKGATRVTTGTFDNSHGGRLSSNDTLSLNAGQVTNQDGGSIASSHALTASVTGLDQQGGQLFSTSALTLDLNHGQLNNQNGYINAPLLVLNNLKGVNNQGGEISSTQAYTFAAESLDNDNGKLLSSQALTLRIDQTLSSIKGLIAAASVDVHAGSLDNSGGTLTSRADLGLTVDGQLTNQNLGLINATNNLTVNSAGINNQGGSLLGSTIALDFGAATGDLNNAAGQITSAGNLTLNHLRDLNNQGGVLSSAQSLNLTARTLDNSNGGQLISNNLLSLTATDLINQNAGLLSGWQGVTLTGSSLDNRNSGTVSSRSGNVGVTLSGALLNSNAGALVSQQTLTVNAASIDNSNKGILSSGAGQSLTVSGLLNNAQGGLIDSGAALTLNAMALTSSGTINAQQALTFTGTDLDNSNGTLSGGTAVTLDLLGTLTNTNGKLSAVGPLLVQRSAQINNQGGQLSSQGLLTLLTGGLDNSNNGTIGSGDKLLITSTGTVQNGNGGLIASRNGDLQLTAASLGNGKGSLQGKGAVSLDISGDIDNQSGKVIAQDGDLFIKAANLDSRGGLLSSISGALTTRVVGVLKNGYDLNNNRQGGLIQAQRLDLQAWGGLDNYGGRIAALTGDALVDTGAGDFDNRNGAIHANGLVQVSGNNFDNSGDNDGQISGRQINLNLVGALNNRLGIIESDSTLSITAARLDNQTGQLRALGGSGKTEFQIGGLFDNSNGKLESANSDLTLGVGSFMNQGGSLLHLGNGTFDTATANIINAGGSLVTRGGLTLTADDWTNSSVIQVGRLTVNVKNLTQTGSGQLLATESFSGSGVNWSNDGLIASDGTASLNLSGSYSGNGRYTSLGTLGLSAAQVSLGNTASIAGGGDTTLNVGGQLNNYGRITSAGGMSVNAGSINNYGTLGSNGNLLLSTPSLLNENGLIFSGGDTALQVNSFTNHSAQLYSFGAVSIGGHGGATQANQVSNIYGTLESTGQFNINAANFENRTEGFSLGRKLVSGFIAIKCIRCWGSYYGANIVVRETFEGQDTDTSAAASLSAGGDFTFRGGSFLNSKSTISAGGNIAIQADNVKNVGAVSGTIERTRSYLTGDIDKDIINDFSDAAFNYNARNNPDFPNIYYINDSGGVSRALAVNSTRGGGRDHDQYPVVAFFDAVTGEGVNRFDLPDDLSNLSTKPQSQYDPNNLVALPSQLQSSPLFALTGDVEVAKDGSASGRSAVIQAGGNVSISATQDLTNSVIHQDYGFSAGANKVQTTQVAGTGAPVVVRINAQLPPNLAQQQVNPLALPGFSLPTGQNGLFHLSGQSASAQQGVVLPDWRVVGTPIGLAERQPGATDVQALAAASGGQSLARVQGLPDTSGRTRPQKYLIETNPVLTDLKQFMSSDYLLSNLGYNPDASAKRLGDGFYEQKLIQQAVVARTGQRFIDGQTSDDSMFKYLMNNAIASKQALNLQLGVSLTSEQVAALTHDIVWMENATVNGEQVLVPVLYLANANNRLAANGALIQGSDVTLIAGKDLNNAGTLRASNNLSATAGNDMVNSGLLEASNRLDALANNNLTNKAGGIISGRDVGVTATKGDVINERTVTIHESSTGYKSEQRGFADSAARIEAANNLTVSAGRDIDNSGGVLKSAQDTTLKAGRDVNITSAEQLDSNILGNRHNDKTITQNGSTVTSGRDLTINAGRDLTAVASQIDAKRNASLSAVDNLMLSSAADEQHSYSQTKKYTDQEDHTQQIGTSVSAGGNVVLTAGKDLGLTSSKVNAGSEAYLSAGANLTLQTAANDDYSFHSMDKKNSSGRKTRLDEVSSTTNIASAVTSGSKTTLDAGKDLLVKGSDVVSTGAVKLTAGNDVQIVAVTDSSSDRHESGKSKSSWLGLKSSKIQDQVADTQTKAKGSLISGDTVEVTAKRDVAVTGSAVASMQDLTVQAGRDLTITAAQNTSTHDEMHKEKNRDLTGVLTANKLGIDDITGNQKLFINSASHNGQKSETTLSGSTLGSAHGNVNLTAGRELAVVASDLISTKDMTLTGSNVTITAGMESSNETSKDKTASLGVGRVMGGSVIDTFNTLYNLKDTLKSVEAIEDPRLRAVKEAQLGLKLSDTASDLSRMDLDLATQIMNYGDKTGGKGSLIKIGTELANSHTRSSSETETQTAHQSSINAGQTLKIVSTGASAGTAGDIHVVGSNLKAGTTVLDAKNNITLESAQNTKQSTSDTSNSRTAIGVSFNLGEQNGFTLDLGAKVGLGKGDGSSVTQVNSTLQTGKLTLNSGKDTTLAGAQDKADTIHAVIGGDLNIASRQDSDKKATKTTEVGAGASICVPPFCYGATAGPSASASLDLSSSKMNSDYKAVKDQSGLFAGNGGYNINVGNNTTLQGAVIASEASADKNLLVTDRLITSDIKNKSDIDSQSASISVSGSYNGAKGFDGGVKSGMPLAMGESDSSKTRSAVSEGTIIVRDAAGAYDLVGLNRDTAHANEALDKPSEKALNDRIDLLKSSMALTGDIVNRVAEDAKKDAQRQKDTAVTQDQKDAADRNYEKVTASWAAGGENRVATNIATGLIGAALGGASGLTTLGIVANKTAEDTKKHIADYADTQYKAAQKANDPATEAAWAEGGTARLVLEM